MNNKMINEWWVENDLEGTACGLSATHILCDCEAIAYLRFCHLGQFFMEPRDYIWRPHKQSPTVYSKCRINKGLIKRGSPIDHWRSQCKGRIIMAHPLYIHSFNCLWLDQSSIPAFAWREWGEFWKILSQDSQCLAEIWTKHLLRSITAMPACPVGPCCKWCCIPTEICLTHSFIKIASWPLSKEFNVRWE
jgi:hypothetical protein